ncbi:unnamed protein product [Moneuplotes crassus]|uniref:Uncharacterized protein n=1 Tax=Euplotes crassus TaxID=5936 RepID=A0AAD1Y791_EUPCR|nr:unnamed protein product [Moneuplotes crassus]
MSGESPHQIHTIKFNNSSRSSQRNCKNFNRNIKRIKKSSVIQRPGLLNPIRLKSDRCRSICRGSSIKNMNRGGVLEESLNLLKENNSDSGDIQINPHGVPQEIVKLDSKKSELGSMVEEVEDIKEESKEPSKRFRKEESKAIPIQKSENDSPSKKESDNKFPKKGLGEEFKENSDSKVAPVAIYCENATLIHYNHGKVEVGAYCVKNNENIHIIQKNIPNSTPTAKKKRLIDSKKRIIDSTPKVDDDKRREMIKANKESRDAMHTEEEHPCCSSQACTTQCTIF